MTEFICPNQEKEEDQITVLECAYRQYYHRESKGNVWPCVEDCTKKTDREFVPDDFNCPFHGWLVNKRWCFFKAETDVYCRNCVKNNKEIRKNLFTRRLKGDIVLSVEDQEAFIKSNFGSSRPNTKRRPTMAKRFIIDTNEMTLKETVNSAKAAKEICADDVYMEIAKEEDLAELSVGDLKRLKKALELDGPGKNKGELTSTIFEGLKALGKPAPRITKSSLLKSAFDEKPVWKQEELIERTGYDAKNLVTACAILRNAKRTKPENMIDIQFNRKDKTYSVATGDEA